MVNPVDDEKFVIVGRLGAAHGIKGWLKVASFTEPRSNLLAYSPWYLQVNNEWVTREVLAARPQGKGLVVHLDGVHDRDQALAFRGVEVAVLREQLPTLENDEYYWTDLVGLEVVTTDNVSFGRITEMMATGANDVMVIQDEQRQRLVPFVQHQVVLSVDLVKATVVVDWDPEF